MGRLINILSSDDYDNDDNDHDDCDDDNEVHYLDDKNILIRVLPL